ncbi:hypothetical protein B0H16DRAFT_1897094, partial [Mycena metata]
MQFFKLVAFVSAIVMGVAATALPETGAMMKRVQRQRWGPVIAQPESELIQHPILHSFQLTSWDAVKKDAVLIFSRCRRGGVEKIYGGKA